MEKELLHIRDAIFGDISLGKIEKDIIESAEFQRLRYVRQIGFGYLVYIGANHTRFEHSIGTMKITKDVANVLCPDNAVDLSIAALLHDVGHAPFSHTLDDVYLKYLKKTHEEIGRDMILHGPINDILVSHGMSVRKILSRFDGDGVGKIITGALGADRIDYLSRDSHYTGVDYGAVDYERIRSKLALHRNMPAIYAQGVSAAESMLIARYSMWRSVYLHHTVVIAGAMLKKGVYAAVESGELEPSLLPRFCDSDLMEELESSNASSGIAAMIRNRKLYKRVYYVEEDGTHFKKEEIEGCLSKAGLGHMDYVVDWRSMKGDNEDIEVLDRSGKTIGKLSIMSPLVGTLSAVLNGKRIFVVATKDGLRAKAQAALRRL